MLSINNRMASNITANRSVHRFATMFTVALVDGTIYRFTDHNEELYDGSNTFTPVSGFNASAREMQDGLQINDVEIVGYLSDSVISADDIRSGRWQNATVTEKIVDWLYPWAGDYGERRYSASEVKWTETRWTVNIEGVGRKLRRKIGDTMGRMCRWDLGDTNCGIDIDSFTDVGEVSGASTLYPRKRMLASGLSAGHPDGYYEYGLVTFTSGANNGLVGEVHKWTQSTGEIILRLPMPFDISIGDDFDIYPGCGKIPEFCKGTSGDRDRPWSNNMAEYGGFFSIPGLNKLIQYPDSRT
jgi:uncharacterized phage protein (TIGR02218 family)